MKIAHPQRLASLIAAAVLGRLLVGCGAGNSPDTSTVNIAPAGDATAVALACGRASVLLYMMTLNDWPPDYRYLDPHAMPGYDAARRAQDALAAEYLGDAIRQLGVWSEQMENDPMLLTRALRENGWTIVEANKKIVANERSWQNLEDRVHWCVAHYHVEIPTEK